MYFFTFAFFYCCGKKQQVYKAEVDRGSFRKCQLSTTFFYYQSLVISNTLAVSIYEEWLTINIFSFIAFFSYGSSTLDKFSIGAIFSISGAVTIFYV